MPEPESGPYGETGWTTEPIMAALTGVATAKMAARLAAAEALLRRARFVADYWRRAALDSLETDSFGLITHPLCMVLAALDGATDPVECGIGYDGIDAFLAAGGDPT